METLVLVFLLAYAGGDEAFKQKIASALTFYRENREILQALTQNKAPMSETEPSESTEVPAGEIKSRPPAGTGDLDVLMKYLGGLH